MLTNIASAGAGGQSGHSHPRLIRIHFSQLIPSNFAGVSSHEGLFVWWRQNVFLGSPSPESLFFLFVEYGWKRNLGTDERSCYADIFFVWEVVMNVPSSRNFASLLPYFAPFKHRDLG